MTAKDRIEEVRSELQEVRTYHQRYNGGRDFTFEETIGRLVKAVELLADEVAELRGDGDDDGIIMGGGIDPVFDPNDRP